MELVPLDLLTVRVMTLITVLMTSLATLLAWRMNRAVAGMSRFALGMLALGIGIAVGLAGGMWGNEPILMLGAVFRFAGLILAVQGVRIFSGFRPRSGVFIGIFTALVVTRVLYGGYAGKPGMHLSVLSIGLALVAADAARSMLWNVPAEDRLSYWPTGFVFGCVALIMSLRAAAYLSGLHHPSAPSSPAIETVTAICANVAFIGAAFGMLAASNGRLRREAELMATFDPLTNLPNRRLFLDRLLEAETRAVSTGQKLGVIYMDLDEFKQVNDTRGHQAGDDLLRKVSWEMQCVLRSCDCLARVGGDEFVVLVEGIQDRNELHVVAERLRRAVEHQTNSGPAPKVRVSCGIAVFPEDGVRAHDVMRHADMDMYHNKRSRRMAGDPVISVKPA